MSYSPLSLVEMKTIKLAIISMYVQYFTRHIIVIQVGIRYTTRTRPVHIDINIINNNTHCARSHVRDIEIVFVPQCLPTKH